MEAKRIHAFTVSVAAIMFSLVTPSCNDGGSGPFVSNWHFSGGIIFELNGGSLANGICVIKPDASDPTTHPMFQGAAEPRLSPDGKRILICRQRGSTFDLFISNLDGTDARNISNTDSVVSESDGDWSPDMQFAACHALFYPSYKEALRLVHTDGSGRAVNLTDTARIRTANMPRYSPDGTRLAYVVQDSLYAPWQLSVVSADGTSERRYGETSVIAPVWSPEGGKLAYGGGDMRLRVLDLGSNQILALGVDALVGPGVIWLAEDRLVYGSIESGLYGVKGAVLAPSLEVSTLASGFSSLDCLVVSPRKDSLAVFGRRGGEAALSLYLMALDGSSLRRIASVDPSSRASASRNGYSCWVE